MKLSKTFYFFIAIFFVSISFFGFYQKMYASDGTPGTPYDLPLGPSGEYPQLSAAYGECLGLVPVACDWICGDYNLINGGSVATGPYACISRHISIVPDLGCNPSVCAASSYTDSCNVGACLDLYMNPAPAGGPGTQCYPVRNGICSDPPSPSCGDTYCNGGETNASCPADCPYVPVVCPVGGWDCYTYPCPSGFWCNEYSYYGFTCEYEGQPGQCGSNATTWPHNATGYNPSSSAFCTLGTPSPSTGSIAFPAQGGNATWNCLGANDIAACIAPVSCTAQRSPAPITATVDINANPLSIPYNTASNISWTSTNATSCSVSPTGWTGTSGSQSTGNLTGNQTYTITCNPGSVSDVVTVSVGAAPAATADIRVNGGNGPITIPYNTNATVSWTSTGATGGCTVSPSGWTGTSGSQSTGNLVASRTYTITCNPGSGTDSAIVNVANPTVNVNVVTTGQGTVTSTSNPVQTNINCGTLCSSSYDVGTILILTATPSPGRNFVGWTGCSLSGDAQTVAPAGGTCTVTVNGVRDIIARFAIDPNFREF